MAISDAQKAIYAYEDTTSQNWDGLVLSHSAAGIFYLTTYDLPIVGQVDGEEQTFQPIPWDFVLPTVQGDGQQDLTLAVCNIGQEMTAALEAAVTIPSEAIRVRITTYIVGSTVPQIDPPYELGLRNIVLTDNQMSGTASRIDVFNAKFPGIVYRPDNYPGLLRR